MKVSQLMNGLKFGMLPDHISKQSLDSTSGKHLLHNYLFQKLLIFKAHVDETCNPSFRAVSQNQLQ